MSIIELIVYGIIGYPAIMYLIHSAFKEDSSMPASKSGSTIRSIWLISAIICMNMLAGAGAVFTIQDEITVTEIGYNITDGSIISNSTTTTPAKQISLIQPVWVSVHWLFTIMLSFYFIWNILQLFTKRD